MAADKAQERAGSAKRCLQIIELLAEDPYLHSLADIAGALKLPKSTTHRLISLLVDEGFVEVDTTTRRYALTAKVLWIGSSYLRNSAVERSALTVMTQLSAETHTTSHLAVWHGDTVLIIHSTDPPNATSLFVEVGEKRPAHATALGKALLSYRSAEDFDRICRNGLARYTPHTITSPAILYEELLRVRQIGVASDEEEYAQGVCCIAAPIHNHQGIAAAMGISGDLTLADPQISARLKRLVQDAALRVSAQLGSRRLSGQFLASRVDTLLAASASVAEGRPSTGERLPDPV